MGPPGRWGPPMAAPHVTGVSVCARDLCGVAGARRSLTYGYKWRSAGLLPHTAGVSACLELSEATAARLHQPGRHSPHLFRSRRLASGRRSVFKTAQTRAPGNELRRRRSHARCTLGWLASPARRVAKLTSRSQADVYLLFAVGNQSTEGIFKKPVGEALVEASEKGVAGSVVGLSAVRFMAVNVTES